MSYAAKDVSQQDSNPVMLYEFVRGSTTWRYAALPPSALTSWTAMGNTWTPEIISCGDINSSGDVPNGTLTITMPITNALAAGFVAFAPDQVTTVTVFRTNYDEPTNGEFAWKGRVLSAPTSVATVSLTCESVFVSVRRMGLRQVYSRSCRHMLFSQGPGLCNVNPADYACAVTVTNVVGNKVNVIAFSGFAYDYTGGTIKTSDGGIMMIVAINVATGLLTLMRPSQFLVQEFAAHPGGFSAIIYPGCDKSTATCRDRYHNLGNHGGFPGITGINPMSGVTNAF